MTLYHFEIVFSFRARFYINKWPTTHWSRYWSNTFLECVGFDVGIWCCNAVFVFIGLEFFSHFPSDFSLGRLFIYERTIWFPDARKAPTPVHSHLLNVSPSTLTEARCRTSSRLTDNVPPVCLRNMRVWNEAVSRGKLSVESDCEKRNTLWVVDIQAASRRDVLTLPRRCVACRPVGSAGSCEAGGRGWTHLPPFRVLALPKIHPLF